MFNKEKKIKKGEHKLADLFIEAQEDNKKSLKLQGELIQLHKKWSQSLVKIMLQLTGEFKKGVNEEIIKKQEIKKNGKKTSKQQK